MHAQRSPSTVATLARADGPHPTSILTPPTEASPPQCTLLSLPHALLESVLRCFDYCSLQQLGGVCSLFHSSLRLTAFSLSILRACSCSLPSSLAALHRLHHGSKQQRYQALHNPLYRALFALDATLQQHDRYMDTWRRMKGEMTGRHSKPSSGGSGRRRAEERGRPWERGWRAMRAWVKEEDPTVHRWLWGDTPVIVSSTHNTPTHLNAAKRDLAHSHWPSTHWRLLCCCAIAVPADGVRRPHVVHRAAAPSAAAPAPLHHHSSASLLALQRCQTTQPIPTRHRSHISPQRQSAAAGRGVRRSAGSVWLAVGCTGDG